MIQHSRTDRLIRSIAWATSSAAYWLLRRSEDIHFFVDRRQEGRGSW